MRLIVGYRQKKRLIVIVLKKADRAVTALRNITFKWLSVW